MRECAFDGRGRERYDRGQEGDRRRGKKSPGVLSACSRDGPRGVAFTNGDKSRGFEDTGQQRDKRRRGGGFNDPLTARRADAGQTSASARSERRKEGTGDREQQKSERGGGGERTSADEDGYGGGGGGGGGGGVKESRREEYIAVIIAIDFYRQTITPGVLLTVTLDVPAMLFFSFSFPSAPSTVPLFHVLDRPPFRRRSFPMHLVSR